GRPEIPIGLIDGPVALDHPDLAGERIREVPGKIPAACAEASDAACVHGTIPRPERVAAERFREAAGEGFDRIMQMTDNAGATDEHRALNYLTVRHPAFYAAVAQAQGRNCSLTAVDVRPFALSGVRNIVEVILSFTDRATDVVEKQFLRVDVTEEFPFLVTKLGPYFDR